MPKRVSGWRRPETKSAACAPPPSQARWGSPAICHHCHVGARAEVVVAGRSRWRAAWPESARHRGLGGRRSTHAAEAGPSKSVQLLSLEAAWRRGPNSMVRTGQRDGVPGPLAHAQRLGQNPADRIAFRGAVDTQRVVVDPKDRISWCRVSLARGAWAKRKGGLNLLFSKRRSNGRHMLFHVPTEHHGTRHVTANHGG